LSPEFLGSGGVSGKLASPSVVLGPNQQRWSTRSSVADLLDIKARRMEASGHGGAPRRAPVELGLARDSRRRGEGMNRG